MVGTKLKNVKKGRKNIRNPQNGRSGDINHEPKVQLSTWDTLA